MSIYDIEINTLAGESTTLEEFRDKVILVVNVASKCGLTPQYTKLEEIHEKYKDQGFSVLGFPCNQFLGQEPGTAEEIANFCSTSYGVTFPLFEKIEVNGENRNPIYSILTEVKDNEGQDGDIAWNFEKFLINRTGNTILRFRPKTEPDDEGIISHIEEFLKK